MLSNTIIVVPIHAKLTQFDHQLRCSRNFIKKKTRNHNHYKENEPIPNSNDLFLCYNISKNEPHDWQKKSPIVLKVSLAMHPPNTCYD